MRSMVWVAVFVVGCGSSTAKKLCKETAACDDSVDEATCIEDFEADAAEAAEAGCEEQFDAFSECAADNAECVDGELVADACLFSALSVLE